MNLQTFFDNFEQLAEAPNGVQKLRDLILQLAVQGKLVPQDKNDEPASALLERLQSEKAILVKEKNIRKANEQPFHVTRDGNPYPVPNCWQWCRIGDFAIVRGGKRLPKGASFSIARTPHIYIQVTNMKKGTIIEDDLKYIDEITYKQIKEYIIEKDDLYITIAGTIGQSGEIPEYLDGMNLTENAAKLIFRGLDKKYALIALNSNTLQQQFINKTNQLAQPKLALKRICDSLFPLPPFEEQKRIVAKVDHLMRLCDELEERQQKKREARIRLNQSALDHLLASSTPEDFNAHWQRICDNFNLLYDTPETISKLRQSILQLAVQGKLVSQDPKGEPAFVLLDKIKTEKEPLIKKGKGKRVEPLPPIDLSSLPYKVPQKWEWVRFCDVATITSNLVQPNSYLDFPHIAPDNIEKQTGNLLPYRTVREDEVRSSNHRFYAGQIVYSKIRPNLSKATIVDFDGLCSADMYPIDAHIDPRFLLKYILSETFLSMAVKNDTRVAMPKINQDELNRILVPVPPLEEQRRIVAKVDQLMKLCDELEAKLTRAQSISENLMASVVNYIFATQEHEVVGAALSMTNSRFRKAR